MGQATSSAGDEVPMLPNDTRRSSHINIAQQPPPQLSPEERGFVWEVNIARHCLESFRKVIDAHAIVFSLLLTANLIGFLQPPKGWTTQNATMYNDSTWVDVFSFCNSLSLYSAISGLLMCVYCSCALIWSLSSIPLPERLDKFGMNMIHMLRSALMSVALPAVRRRSIILLFFLLSSLLCSVVAYISAGLAATDPAKRFVCVILPSIPGCTIVLVLLYASAAKVILELDFERRLKLIWDMIGKQMIGKPDMPMPNYKDLSKSQRLILDPMPPILGPCVAAFLENKFLNKSKYLEPHETTNPST